MPTFRVSSSPTPRPQLQSTARGVIAEPWPVALSPGAAIPTAGAASGTLSMTLVGLRAGDVVTNISCGVTITGTGLTFVKLGLWDSSGALLAATASVSASFNSGTGYKTIALTAPYTITADGGYYLGFLQYGSGATGATLLRGLTSTMSTLGSGVRANAGVAGQSDLGSVTPGDAATAYWFAAS